MGGNCPSLLQEWESAHTHVITLTEFNGHLYSGGWKSNKIQKWNEQGQLVQEWEAVHTHAVTLTEFNGHLYSGGNNSKKIQKWNEQGQLVQEWESAHTHVVTLTEFNGHLYSGGYNSKKIQKWFVKDVGPLSLPPRLTRNRKMELLTQQSDLEEAVVKYIEQIEQEETEKETEH